jgi:hypothetical protein
VSGAGGKCGPARGCRGGGAAASPARPPALPAPLAPLRADALALLLADAPALLLEEEDITPERVKKKSPHFSIPLRLRLGRGEGLT